MHALSGLESVGLMAYPARITKRSVRGLTIRRKTVRSCNKTQCKIG